MPSAPWCWRQERFAEGLEVGALSGEPRELDQFPVVENVTEKAGHVLRHHVEAAHECLEDDIVTPFRQHPLQQC
jgi:hypothetical protein